MSVKISKVEKEFILRNSSSENVPFHLHGSRRETHCALVEISREFLAFQSLDEEWKHFSSWDKVSGYFTFRGQVFSFSSKIRKLEDGKINVINPDCILKGPDRLYIRVPPPQGLKLGIYLETGNYALDFPLSREYLPAEAPERSMYFEYDSLNSLIDGFKEKASLLANDYRIVMFKNRKPESLEERLIAKFGRILYLPSMKTGLPISDPYPKARVITKNFEEERQGKKAEEIDSSIERLVADKAKKDIRSEIWCPILYGHYTTGYVYIANLGPDAGCFNFDTVDFVYDFSRFLAFFLERNKYFDDDTLKTAKKAHEADVVDISASGILVSTQDPELPHFLARRSLVEAAMSFHKTKIVVPARIVRSYVEDGKAFVGLEYQSISSVDLETLYEFIYKKPYAHSSGEGHSGG